MMIITVYTIHTAWWLLLSTQYHISETS